MKLKRHILMGVISALCLLLIGYIYQSENLRFSLGMSTTNADESTKALSPLTNGVVTNLRQVQDDDKKKQQEKVKGQIEAMLTTSILFYGKVIDDKNSPVSSAKIAYSLLDRFNASGSVGSLIAHDDGYFEISGVKGAVLGVNVSKEGYYQIQNISNQRFAYGMSSDAYTKPPPSKSNPAIFVLHKMGKTESLIELTSRQFIFPASGDPINIDLTTGKTGANGLQISSKIANTDQYKFSWEYVLTVVGGGLKERVGQFDFEAPADGYLTSISVGMEAADPNWKMGTEKSFFVKFANGTYGRIQLQFYPRRNQSMVIVDSYLNPVIGSRILESDPATVQRVP